MAKKRNRLQIIKDILETIQKKNGRVKPTHILYKSNLSHQMMTEYLTELITKEFIIEETSKTKSKTYFITDKGRDFLSRYSMINEFVNSFGLESN